MSVKYLPPFLPADLRALLPNPAKGLCSEVVDSLITFRQKVELFYAWMMVVDKNGNVTGFSDAFKNKLCDEMPLCLHVGTTTTSTVTSDFTTASTSTAVTDPTTTQSTASPAPCILSAPHPFIQNNRLYWNTVPNATSYEVFLSCGGGELTSLGLSAPGVYIKSICDGCGTAAFYVQAHADGCTSSALGGPTQCTGYPL